MNLPPCLLVLFLSTSPLSLRISPAPSVRKFPISTSLLGLFVALTPPAFAAEAAPALSPLVPAWRDASMTLFKESHDGFDSLSGAEAEFGLALTLLVQQPQTTANVERAKTLLTALATRKPADDFAPAARYYLGRIEQVHRQTPAPAAAREHYALLLAEVPGHYYAQLATVKLAILDLYEPVDASTRRARFDALLPVPAALTLPEARRDLALLLADVALQFDYGQPTALDLLLQAERVGISRPLERAEVWIRIAELARLEGRHAVARDYYQRFLATFKRDNRRQMASEHLASLPAE